MVELRGLTLLVLVLFFSMAQIAEAYVKRDVVCTQDKMCAQEHAVPVVPGADVFLREHQAIEKCVGDATLT
ncbi:hypothetical protein PTKIN_Ptkin02bG0092000 [Pterospermum kingtungense]